MSVIVGVVKSNTVAIAADTMTSQGSLRVPGDMKVSPSKILEVGDGYVGIVGSVAHLLVLESILSNHPDVADFSSKQTVFESFRKMHGILKEEYFLVTDEDDEDQEYESNQMFGMICNPTGLYSFQSYREVVEYNRFWACGSGNEFALGALHASYTSRRSARKLAECAVEAACRFDKGCALPLESYEVELATT